MKNKPTEQEEVEIILLPPYGARVQLDSTETTKSRDGRR